jgi:4-hydroxy-3-methylbut-2-enyl diphosphate reductase
MSQTTTVESTFEEIVAALRAANPRADIRVATTICHPTRERQQSLRTLLGEVDALVVVGGRRSRNSLELVETARRAGILGFLVQGAADLDPRWFDGAEAVGITAGTSTLPETFEEVHTALRAIAAEARGAVGASGGARAGRETQH